MKWDATSWISKYLAFVSHVKMKAWSLHVHRVLSCWCHAGRNILSGLWSYCRSENFSSLKITTYWINRTEMANFRDAILWKTEIWRCLIVDHVPTPPPPKRFHWPLFGLLPSLPHKLKVPKMDVRKPKSSKISQQYNHPWQVGDAVA